MNDKKKIYLVDTRDKGDALYNKSNLDVDKWATWLMLCYFGNFGGSNPPPPTSDVEITRTNIGGENVKKIYLGRYQSGHLVTDKIVVVLKKVQ